MTVDIAAVAEEARRVQVEPFGASVGHGAAAVWENAARALAAERDQFRDTALRYAADFGALAAGIEAIAEDLDARAKTTDIRDVPKWTGDTSICDRLRALLSPEGGAR